MEKEDADPASAPEFEKNTLHFHMKLYILLKVSFSVLSASNYVENTVIRLEFIF